MNTKSAMFLLSMLFLTACVTLPGLNKADLENRIAQGEKIARDAGLTKKIIQTDTFRLVTFGTLKSANSPVNIYIEGDGLAWESRRSPSKNPTPTDPVALRLAALDQADNVIYIARPCQFIQNDPACSIEYWTSHRYAPEVLNSLNQVINYVKIKYGATSFNFIGFSGGGNLATILASQRSDILTLRTVAGNLDHVALNEYHDVSQMPQSLNAVDFAKAVQHVPQIHFIGADDRVVPDLMAKSFEMHLEDKSCVQLKVVQGTSHTSGWTGRWRRLMEIPPECREMPAENTLDMSQFDMPKAHFAAPPPPLNDFAAMNEMEDELPAVTQQEKPPLFEAEEAENPPTQADDVMIDENAAQQDLQMGEEPSAAEDEDVSTQSQEPVVEEEAPATDMVPLEDVEGDSENALSEVEKQEQSLLNEFDGVETGAEEMPEEFIFEEDPFAEFSDDSNAAAQ